MWTLHTDSGNSLYGGQYAKNIYLGDTRIVTKLNSGKDPTYQEESQKQYYYHSDHLGSASLISDYNGKEYQRIEYTPYGETWVEKTSNTGNEFLPYKFTGKEIDEETGLYYYGARYLDPKYSLWISAAPALGDYIPGVGKATANDIGNLPGMGGAFNHINFNLYHYAGNNPVKYVDPDGRFAYGPDGEQYSTLQKKELKGYEGVPTQYREILESQKTKSNNQLYRWPLESNTVTSEFGYRTDAVPNKHDGLDLSAKKGTPVYAASTGKVSLADLEYAGSASESSYLIIEGNDGYQQRYLHISFLVNVNEDVRIGQLIGYTGDRKNMEPHLHFEIRKDGKPINPRLLLPKL